MRHSGYDAELRRHNEVLRSAAAVRPHDHVLDIGCGAGLTTREAARAARQGRALGVDISAPAIAAARAAAASARSAAGGLHNVTFEQADVQNHRLPAATFDVAISRFGTMFFADPVAAFTTVGRALRPGGRLVMIVWQARELNEWDVEIRRALDAAPAMPDPFALADPATVTKILQAAGFTDITFTDVHEPVFYGPDVAAALDWVRGFSCTSEALAQLDPAAATAAEDRLRQTFTAHTTDEGVRFDSRAWLITATV